MSPIAGANSSTYAFTAAMDENGNEYRAVFSNTLGSATTSPATIMVAAGSYNWSGYAAQGQGFSAVTGSWNVPAVTCPASATSYSSQWIGIDGDGSPTVEQDGTESDCVSGTPSYDAWYEMYGENVNGGYAVALPTNAYPIAPGDSMSASVSVTGSTWTLVISDATAPRNWTFTTNIVSPSPAPQQASAEWILERPEVNNSLSTLSDFGTAAFTNATAINNAASGPISALGYQPVEMSNNNNQALATPGPLSASGSAFSVTWDAGS